MNDAFGVPFAQPAAGIGDPLPARFTTVELPDCEGPASLQAFESELDCSTSAVSGPTFAAATPESPCAVWQWSVWETFPCEVAMSALTPFGPPTWAPAASNALLDPSLFVDESAFSTVRQSSLPELWQIASRTWVWIGSSGPWALWPGPESTPRSSCPNRARVLRKEWGLKYRSPAPSKAARKIVRIGVAFAQHFRSNPATSK